MREYRELIKDMIEYLPDDCAGMINDLAEADSMPSMVQTLRNHANIPVGQAAKDHEQQPRQKALDPPLG